MHRGGGGVGAGGCDSRARHVRHLIRQTRLYQPAPPPPHQSP